LNFDSKPQAANSDQAEIEEVWKMFNELNELKNSILERNEDLRAEISQFKTHFNRYEA
jgi:hypothetical protein